VENRNTKSRNTKSMNVKCGKLRWRNLQMLEAGDGCGAGNETKRG